MAEFSVKFSLNPNEHETTVNLMYQGVIALERIRNQMIDELEIDFDYVDEEAVERIEFVNNELTIAKTVLDRLVTVDN
jgi:hypothetical protein